MHLFAEVQACRTLCQSRAFQDGTASNDHITAVGVGIDGSVFLAGRTSGDWKGINAGGIDFAVCKLGANGTETWRWQVSVSRPNIKSTALKCTPHGETVI